MALDFGADTKEINVNDNPFTFSNSTKDFIREMSIRAGNSGGHSGTEETVLGDKKDTESSKATRRATETQNFLRAIRAVENDINIWVAKIGQKAFNFFTDNIDEAEKFLEANHNDQRDFLKEKYAEELDALTRELQKKHPELSSEEIEEIALDKLQEIAIEKAQLALENFQKFHVSTAANIMGYQTGAAAQAYGAYSFAEGYSLSSVSDEFAHFFQDPTEESLDAFLNDLDEKIAQNAKAHGDLVDHLNSLEDLSGDLGTSTSSALSDTISEMDDAMETNVNLTTFLVNLRGFIDTNRDTLTNPDIPQDVKMMLALSDPDLIYSANQALNAPNSEVFQEALKTVQTQMGFSDGFMQHFQQQQSAMHDALMPTITELYETKAALEKATENGVVTSELEALEADIATQEARLKTAIEQLQSPPKQEHQTTDLEPHGYEQLTQRPAEDWLTKRHELMIESVIKTFDGEITRERMTEYLNDLRPSPNAEILEDVLALIEERFDVELQTENTQSEIEVGAVEADNPELKPDAARLTFDSNKDRIASMVCDGYGISEADLETRLEELGIPAGVSLEQAKQWAMELPGANVSPLAVTAVIDNKPSITGNPNPMMSGSFNDVATQTASLDQGQSPTPKAEPAPTPLAQA